MVEVLNTYGRLWLPQFALVVAQNTLFLLILFWVLHALRGTSARVRFWVAIAGLLKLITPPFMPLGPSHVSTYVELSPFQAGPEPLVLPATASVGHPISITIAGLLFSFWAIIAIGMVSHALIATAHFRLELRGATRAGDAVSERWFNDTGILVRVTKRVPVPMTVGVFPRTIFVPPNWEEWTVSGKRTVLRHEMAHIQRHDGLVRVFETLVSALYWFHPLVTLLIRRIDTYREQACDEMAASTDPWGRLAYSRLLVEIADSLVSPSRSHGPASTLVRRRNELFRRVQYLTSEESIMKLNGIRIAAVIAALVVALTSLSWYYSTATPHASTGPGVVEVSIASEGTVTVDGKNAPFNTLGALLKDRIDAENPVVSISCNENVPMKTVYQMHAVLRAVGLLRVKYEGPAGGRMPLVLPSEELIEKTKTIPAEHITRVDVAATGRCAVDGEEVELSALETAIAARLLANDKLIVSVHVSGNATYGQYLRTLKTLRAAGANRIFINEPASP